jgi:hypothetical protein
MEPGATKPTFIPHVRDEDFAKALASNAFKTIYCPKATAHLHGPAMILLVATPKTVWLVGPKGMIDQHTKLLRLQGSITSEGGQKFLFVSDWQPADKQID